jgi:hypothetical protein
VSAQTDKIKADLAKVKELAASIGLGSTPSGKNNVNTQIQNNVYGITQALINAYPELASAYQMLKDNNYAGAEQAILNSSFYKDNNSTAQQRLKSKVEQPAVYADNLERYILATKERLVKTGVKLEDSLLRSIAASAFDKGLDDNQLDRLVMQSGKIGAFGGSILTGIQAVKSYARDYGVSYNKNWWDAQSSKLFAGETTIEDIQQEVRDTAKSKFPAYADYFDKGISLLAVGSSKISAISSLLEIDADAAAQHPLFFQFMQYVDPGTGKPAVLPDWAAEREVRKTSAWRLTNNGQEKIGSLMLQPMMDWGLI